MARTSAQVQADITAVQAARAQIIAGNRVNDVWRDGRRLSFEKMTLRDCRELLAELDRELEAAIASEDGRPRRRPIRTVYGN